jgi:ABC-type Zn uptake system ZnuABC Zn-binding protein ZnuA
MEVLQIISSPKAIEREQIQGMSAETQATFALGEAASEYFENKDEMIRALELLKAEKEKQAEKEKRRAERQFAESALDGSRKKQRELKSSDFADVRDITPTTPNDRGTRASSRKNLEDTLAGFDEKAQTTRAELEEIEILRDTIDQSEKYSY